MKRLALTLLLPLFALGFSSCASVDSSVSAESTLKNARTFYVEHLEDEEHGIDRMIAQRLTAMGYRATYGGARPARVDAVVRYHDKWMWDMTMYLLELHVTLHDGSSNAILAKGKSYRPSLQRKEPEAMVAEVLDSIFSRGTAAQ